MIDVAASQSVIESDAPIEDVLPICNYCKQQTRNVDQKCHRSCELRAQRMSSEVEIVPSSSPPPKKRKRDEGTPIRRAVFSQSENEIVPTPPQSQLGPLVESQLPTHEMPTFEYQLRPIGLLEIDCNQIVLKYTQSRIPFHSTIPEILRPSLLQIVNILLTAYLSTELEIYAVILLIFPRIFLYTESPPSEATTTSSNNATSSNFFINSLLARLTKITTLEDILQHVHLWLRRDFTNSVQSSSVPPTQQSIDRRLHKLAASDRIFTIRRLAQNKSRPILTPSLVDVVEIQKLLDTTSPLPDPIAFDNFTLRPTSIVTPRRISRALSALNKAAAPGLSGWNHHLISNLLSAKGNVNLFAAFLSRIAMGQTSPLVTKILTSFHIFPLLQLAKNKIRPVCMGEHLLKLLSKILWSKVLEDQHKQKQQIFGPDQFAVGERDGVAKMTSIVSAALSEGKTVLIFDAKNAFPSADRAAIIRQLAVTHTYLKPVIPLLHTLLCSSHELHLYNNNVLKEIFSVTNGIPQGAMDASFLFTLLTRTLSKDCPNYRLLRYIDDFALICDHAVVDEAQAHFSHQAHLLGLTLEHSKTRYLRRPKEQMDSQMSPPMFVKILGTFVQAKCEPREAELSQEQIMDFSHSCPFPDKVANFAISAHCKWLVIAKVNAMKLHFISTTSDICVRHLLLECARKHIITQIQMLLGSQSQFVLSLAPLRPQNPQLAQTRDGVGMPLFKMNCFAPATPLHASENHPPPNDNSRQRNMEESNRWDKSTIFHQAHSRQHITDAHFILLLAFRLKLLLPRRSRACAGQDSVKVLENSDPDQVIHHMLSCTSCSSHYFNRRHEDINHLIAKFFHLIGVCYSLDPPGLYKDKPAPSQFHGKVGPDALIVADKTYIVDLAITKASKGLLEHKWKEKMRQYHGLLTEYPNIVLIPLVFSHSGVVLPASRAYLLHFFNKHLQIFNNMMDEIHTRLMVNLAICIELWFVRSTATFRDLDRNS